MGSGFRTFTAGEVLTASNVQDYLMDQSVMVFGGSAARSSAIGTANFEEGMVSYLTDTDKVEAYNGTDWVSVAPTTSQGLTLINTTSFSGVSSQSVNDVFSASYSVYFVDINVSTSAAGGAINLRLRVGGADTSTTIYRRQYLQASSTTLTGARETTNTSFVGVIPFENSRNSGNNLMIVNPFETVPTSGVSHWAQSLAGNIDGFSLWYGINDSVSYTGFTILPSTGTMTGTVSVYGKQR